MLDYNHQPKFADRMNAVVDERLASENAARPPRTYLGGSRLGHACERALQFEFAGAPKDEGADFSGRTLRIFGIGHALEDLAVCWLRGAGFDLYTRKGNRPDGEQFGFSVAGGRIRGHVDGIIAAAPEALGLAFPALWECKTMNAQQLARDRQQGRGGGKARLCGADRTLPGLHGRGRSRGRGQPGAVHRHQQGHCRASPRARAVRRRLAQRMSDRGGAHPAGDRCRRTSAPHRPRARFPRMPHVPVGRSLLGAAGMSDEHRPLQPLARLQRCATHQDAFGIEPDRKQIATFLDVVFGYCEGLMPVRGFVDKGQGLDGKPHNIWIEADAPLPTRW